MDRSLTEYNNRSSTFHSGTTAEDTSTLNQPTSPLLQRMRANSASGKATSTDDRPKSGAELHKETAFMIIPMAHIGPGVRRKSVRRKCSIFEVRQGRLDLVSVGINLSQAIRKALRDGRLVSRKLHWTDASAGLGTRQPLNEHMLSKQLRTLRLQKDLSIFELSQKSGVRLHLLADFERGAWQADQKTLAQLASALEVKEAPVFQYVRQGQVHERGKPVSHQATKEGDHDND